MGELILGIVLFLGAHSVSMARGLRAGIVGRVGEGGYKGLYSLVSLVGFVLIVRGLRHIGSRAGCSCGSRRRGCGI